MKIDKYREENDSCTGSSVAAPHVAASDLPSRPSRVESSRVESNSERAGAEPIDPARPMRFAKVLRRASRRVASRLGGAAAAEAATAHFAKTRRATRKCAQDSKQWKRVSLQGVALREARLVGSKST